MLIPPEIYEEIQELVELQDHIYDLCEENYSEFLDYLSHSQFLSNSIYVRKLLLCIYSAFRFNFKNSSVLCRVLVEIKDYLQKFLTSDEIVMNLRNNAARVALFECGLIKIESIIKDSNFNNFCFRFFYPEIKEHDIKFYDKMLNENHYLKKSMSYLAPDVNLHKELRRHGKSEHKITQIIRDDDIDAFQEYVSLQNFAMTEQVPYSVYDTNDFANNEDKMPYLIECSAYYGSVKIFKYIFMALQSLNIELPTTLPSYAVAGGNYDIIHIVEENFKKNPNSGFEENSSDDDEEIIEQRINLLQNILYQYNRNLSHDQIKAMLSNYNDKRQKLSTFARNNVIQATIEFHRNNVLEYIIENYSPKAERLWHSSKTFISSIQFLNFRQMLYFLTSDENDEKENSSAENSDNDIDDDDTDNETAKNKNIDENKEEEQKIETDKDIKNEINDDSKLDNNKKDDDDDDNDEDNENTKDNHTSDNDDNEEENRAEQIEEEDKKWVFDINLAPTHGYPPLIQSVFESRIDVIRFVLSVKDVDVNITTNDGCTPLMLASMYGYISIVKSLVEMKHDEINFNQTSNDGSTAFMMACHYGHLDIVKYLASLTTSRFKTNKFYNTNENNNNNDNEEKTENDESSKKSADDTKNTENDENDEEDSLGLIIDINKPDNKGYCPFYVACTNGYLQIVKFLSGFKNVKMIQNGKIPHQIAQYKKHHDIVDFLDNNPTYQEQKDEMEEKSSKPSKIDILQHLDDLHIDDEDNNINPDNDHNNS